MGGAALTPAWSAVRAFVQMAAVSPPPTASAVDDKRDDDPIIFDGGIGVNPFCVAHDGIRSVTSLPPTEGIETSI